MRTLIVRCVLIGVVIALPAWLCISGKARLDADELSGEVRGGAPPQPLDAPSAMAPLIPPALRGVEREEAAALIEKLRALPGATYPCTAHLEVRVRKLTEPESSTSSHVDFQLDVQSADRWTLTSDEKQRGTLALARDGLDLCATLPWEIAGYRCAVSESTARGPLVLPESMLDPRFVAGVDENANTVQLAATTSRGRVRSASFTVDLATGVVKRIEAHVHNAPSVDRRYDFVFVQEITRVEPSTGDAAAPPRVKASEMLSALEVPAWEPLPRQGK